MTSVVIPAHNEEAVIGDTLETLLRGARPGELEVVVAANGCDDRTEEIARSFAPTVRVVSTPVPSKPVALNLGESLVRSFPRFFLDADVRLPIEATRATVAALDEPGVLAAAPRLAVDCTGCSAAVRSYYRIWTRLPYAREGLVGSGVYALSAEGRARFGEFPDLIADDLFVRERFAPDERRVVPEVSFTIRAARSVRGLVRRKTRVFLGNAQLARAGAVRERPPLGGGWVSVLRRHPACLADAPVYALVNGVAKVQARTRLWRGSFADWGRDESSRRLG